MYTRDTHGWTPGSSDVTRKFTLGRLKPLPFPSPLLPLPLEVGPQIQLGGLGERCKLPLRGLGRSPSRNRIWCILALKSDISGGILNDFSENQLTKFCAV